MVFPYFSTLFFIYFLICFFIECKILDFTNFLVPTFWKSDKNFVCNDFFIFLFFRYFEIIKFSHDSAFFEILTKNFELNYKFKKIIVTLISIWFRQTKNQNIRKSLEFMKNPQKCTFDPFLHHLWGPKWQKNKKTGSRSRGWAVNVNTWWPRSHT